MSVEALVWAFNFAPAPSARAAAVLIGLANHAQPDGTDAFPSIARLARYARCDERTVQRALRELEDAGVIRSSASRVVDLKIARADRRPNSYDLAMHLYRDDLSDDELDRMAREAQLAPHVAMMRAQRRDAQALADDAAQSPGRGDNLPPRRPARGDTLPPREVHGVTAVRERGDTLPPEPSLEPLLTPVVTQSHQARAREPVDKPAAEAVADAVLAQVRAELRRRPRRLGPPGPHVPRGLEGRGAQRHDDEQEDTSASG